MKSTFCVALSALLVCSALLLCGCSMSIGGLSVYKYNDGGVAYSVGDFSTGDVVRAVTVDWIMGNVVICPTDEDVFSVTEEAVGEISEDYRMRYSFSDGVLSIKFCKNGVVIDGTKMKSLKISVPGGTKLDRINVNCVSADVKLCRADIKTADIETVSGDVYTLELSDIYSSASTPSAPRFEICDADISTVSGNVSLDETVISLKRDINTVSGDVTLIQSAENGDTDIETTSGDVTLTFAEGNASEGKALNTDIKTVSGDVKITLPSEASVTVEFDTVSGDFECSREVGIVKEHGKNGIYRIGDGAQHIEVETTSGNLTIE